MGTSSPKRKRRCSSSALTKAKKYCRNRRSSSHKYSQRRNWSNMGVDILEDIHKKLCLVDTLISRAVCSLWRSVSKNHIIPSSPLNSPPPRRSLPPLLWYYKHPYSEYWLLDVAHDGGKLYLPANHETKRLLRRNTCVGSSSSSHGGYLLFHDDTKNVNKLVFLHPFLLSIFSVHIPPINDIWKALVLADPIITDTTNTSSSCHSLVVLDCDDSKLKFAKCGTTSQFSELEGQDHKWRIEDTEMIFINDCIYAIRGSALDHYMEVWDCSHIHASDDDDDGPRKVLSFQPTFTSFDDAPTRRSTLHLVESQGELLLVAIVRPTFGSPILRRLPVKPTCSVYRMDFKEKRWVRVDSLGDRVLFIMELQTVSLSSIDFPQYEKNSIYFRHHLLNDDSVRPLWIQDPIPKSHLVVFNMEDSSLKELGTTVTGIC